MCDGCAVRGQSRRAALLAAGALVLGATVMGCSSPSGPSVTQNPSGRASSRNPGNTAPSADPEADRVAKARALAGTMSDDELVGQLLMPSIGLDDTPASAAALIRQHRLGGVILMGNVENTSAEATANQVRALTQALRDAAQPAGKGLVPLIATDQEYGWVTRIKSGVVQLPSAMAFGAANRPELTEAAWRGAGRELASIGINVDFAPDADVLATPGNYIIGSRSYGSDPKAVAGQVAAVVRGLQSAGVAAAPKHFPGHGSTTVNSHDALPVLSQTLASLAAGDLPPFEAGIDAGTWLVMSGHLDVQAIDPGVPASFSSKVLVELLRTKLGYGGVVVTDALNMEPAKRWAAGEAAVRAFLAGNDLLLMPPDLAEAKAGLLTALASARIPRERLLTSVVRILALKLRLAAATPPVANVLASSPHRDAALAVAAAAVTVLKGSCAGPFITGPVRVTASGGRSQQASWLTAALKAQGISVVGSGGQRIHLVGYADGAGDLAGDAAITVAMDTPFLLRSAVSAARLATYSSTQVSMQALAAVLAGKATPTGRSPVEVAGLPRSTCPAP
jgi:beta-N-acetylhexosaminidase